MKAKIKRSADKLTKTPSHAGSSSGHAKTKNLLAIASFATGIVAILALVPAITMASGEARNARSADAHPLAKYTKIGFDAEFMPRAFAWLIPHFDFDTLDKVMTPSHREKILDDSVTRDYLLDRSAFEELPEHVKTELAKDLRLDSSPQLQREGTTLLDAQGNSMAQAYGRQGAGLILSDQPQAPREVEEQVLTKQGLIVNQTKLILPSDQFLNDVRRSTQKPSQSDWAILNTRWNLLPTQTRAELVHLRHLSNVKQAEVITRLPIPTKRPADFEGLIPLRTDAPAWMRKVRYSLDGLGHQKAIEIALDGPYEDVNEAFEVLNSLLDATHTSRLMEKPHEQKRMDVAFHLHIGLTEDAPRELVERMRHTLVSFKKLTAIRILAAGTHNDSVLAPFGGLGFNEYDVPLERKGLVRLVTKNHVELREQTQHPRDTYREFLDLLKLEPIPLYRRVQRETAELIAKDPSIAVRIARLNPALLSDFTTSIVMGLRNHDASDFLRTLAEKPEPKYWAQADLLEFYLEYQRDPDPAMKKPEVKRAFEKAKNALLENPSLLEWMLLSYGRSTRNIGAANMNLIERTIYDFMVAALKSPEGQSALLKMVREQIDTVKDVRIRANLEGTLVTEANVTHEKETLQLLLLNIRTYLPGWAPTQVGKAAQWAKMKASALLKRDARNAPEIVRSCEGLFSL